MSANVCLDREGCSTKLAASNVPTQSNFLKEPGGEGIPGSEEWGCVDISTEISGVEVSVTRL